MKKIAVGGINIEKIEAVIKSLVADNNIISGIPDVTNNTDVEVEMIGTGIKAELMDGYL